MAPTLLINLDVPALEPAIAFYRDAFGFTPGRRLFENTVAEMLGAPSPIYLIEKPARDFRRHWTPVHLDVVVDDLESALARALSAGARLEGEVGTFAFGRLATLADPFGHGICLLEWLGRGYDEVA